MVPLMDEERADLTSQLEAHYRRAGWVVNPGAEPDTLEATGPGGVDWVGTALLGAELDSPHMEERLRRLADRRMPSGEICPLDLVTSASDRAGVDDLLRRLRLGHLRHISVYSLDESPTAAAA